MAENNTLYADPVSLAIILPLAQSDLILESNNYVSRLLDKACNRTFNESTETKYYDTKGNTEIIIDDFNPDDDTLVYIDDVLLTASTDYEFYPLNKTPKTSIKLYRAGNRLKIMGKFGYGYVPVMITHIANKLVQVDYNNTVERSVLNERLGNWSGAYTELEQSIPTVARIRELLTPYRRTDIV